MSLFDQLKSAVAHAVHIRPAQLKNAPFLHAGQEEAVAGILNALVAPKIEQALTAAPALAENALHLRPNELKGFPAIHDPTAAAAHVNDLVAALLGDVGK